MNDGIMLSGGASGGILGGKVAGAYYTTFIGATAWTNATPQAIGVMTCSPIYLTVGTLDRIAQQHNATVGAAGEVARMGIYQDNGNGIPGTLLLDAGTIALDTATGLKAITISQGVPSAGLYWLALARQGPSVNAILIGSGGVNSPHPLLPAMGPAGSNLYEAPAAWQLASVTGAFPASFTGTAMTGSTQNVSPPFVRYSA